MMTTRAAASGLVSVDRETSLVVPTNARDRQPSDSSSLGSTAWDASEALHVRRAVFAAPLQPQPSPHAYVENIFSPAMYAAMERFYPADSPALRRWDNPGDPSVRFGNYSRRQEIHIPAEAQRLTPAQRAFWLDAAAFLHGPVFARALLDRFEPYARSRFGDRIDDPAFVTDRLRGTMIVSQHDADYYLGPHTDRSEKVFTCLFYFPERDGLEHLGTTLYRPLDPGFACSGLVHHDPSHFAATETLPYRPNSALIFARTDVMFHGVRALTSEQLQGSRRRSIQMQFWLHNARPRAACKTSLWASVPAGMRVGADEEIGVRLTNRADCELDSSFPYTTNLSYRWFDSAGMPIAEDGVRTPLPRPLAPGETADGSMRVVAPRAPGRYLLRLSLVQEGVAWFDDIDPDNGAAEPVAVHDRDRAAEAPADIVPDSHDIALGAGWSAPERAGAEIFRRVEHRAIVHVAALRAVRHVLRIVADPAPNARGATFALAARLTDGRELGTVNLAKKGAVTFALPPQSPCAFSVELRAGSALRVFSIAVERTVDVFPAWATAASGFYPLERRDADVFRWVGSDATLTLDPSGTGALEFDAESGPGMRSRPFRLRVLRPGGGEVVSAEVGSRTRVRVPLGDVDRPRSLLLRAEGGGASVDGDPRTLNFRVFPAGA